MVKKAVLVDFSIRTRVVVDVPEGKDIDSEEFQEKIMETAVERVRQNFQEDMYYPYQDNQRICRRIQRM